MLDCVFNRDNINAKMVLRIDLFSFKYFLLKNNFGEGADTMQHEIFFIFNVDSVHCSKFVLLINFINSFSVLVG